MTENIENNKGNNKTTKALSPRGSALLNELTKRNLVVFNTADASKVSALPAKDTSEILFKLYHQGWLGRIGRGKYFLIPLGEDVLSGYTESSLLIASKLISPYYIGFWTMLHHYGYTEQFANTMFIASTKRAVNITLSGVTYQFVNLSNRKFFGISSIAINGNAISVSDREKTLIDCLDHPEHCGGILEVSKGLWKARTELDFAKMLDYLEQLGQSAAVKRLGYLMNVFNLQASFDVKKAKALIGRGFSKLDPLSPDSGQYNSDWNLLVNQTKEDILVTTRI
ncbi:MAG: type IV toxin-antitoxin system AbiEi family antitoxin [Elusimicrobiales bacterium]|nr:type IV toxin-antitoxin system AbiEi family antitoxin [Elusimicrobiales bacterium]